MPCFENASNSDYICRIARDVVVMAVAPVRRFAGFADNFYR
jgi:hypothetical protein